MNVNPCRLLASLLLLCAGSASGGGLPTDELLTPASADTTWRWIGIRNGVVCPMPASMQWTSRQLFRFPGDSELPPGLEDFCVYETSEFPPDGPDPSPVLALQCGMQPPPCLSGLSPDSLSVAYMGATAQDLEDIMAGTLRAQMWQQAGRYTSWDSDQRVRLSIIDTEPRGLDQDLDGPGNSEHGFSLLNIVRDLLCAASGPCGVQISSGLGLPRVFCAASTGVCVDGINGGYVGTIGDLAIAIREQVRDWTMDGSTASLVINLSVAWDGLFNIDASGASRVAASAVYAALEDASCRGALVIAATGNGQGGPAPAAGPMYPGGWEVVDAPSFARCSTLVSAPLDPSDFGPPGEYRPLVHAIAGVDTFNEPVTPRIDATPRLVAYADHAVTEADFDGVPGPTAVMSGTSVSAAVVSAAAAAAWYFRADLAGWEVMNLIHGEAEPLGSPGMPVVADFCNGTGACPPVRRVRICDAVRSACEDPGADCPAFACPARSEVMPAYDIAEIDTRFMSSDAFDIPEAVNQATVAACGSGYTLYWKTNPMPPNPCPHRQFDAVQSTPWTDGQPSGVPCELCTSGARSPAKLYIEVKQAFLGELQDLTLVCGGNPTVDPGPFDAYRIETPAPLTGGDKFRVDNLPERCEVEGMALASTVFGTSSTPASSVSVIFYATDRDNDGIKDTEDNCEVVANDQTDTDGDGIGNRCDPDIAPETNDCMVNFLDILTFKDAIFSMPGDADWNPDADYNGDDRVNFGDVSIMKEYFLGVPGPSGLPDLCD